MSNNDNIEDNGVLQDSIPIFSKVQMDILEFWCQIALQECEVPALYAQRCQGFYETIQQIPSIPEYGRIHNRLQLAMLCADVNERPVISTCDDEEDEDEEEEEQDADVALCQLPATKWAEYRDNLESLRTKLLRKDANCDATEPPNNQVNTELESRAKFSIDYDAVMNMLEVCEIVARFQSSLDTLLASKSSNQKLLLEQIKSAVDSYKNGIQNLQLAKDLSDKLTSFLLADLYKSKPKNLAQHLKDDLFEIMTNDEHECGYHQIALKTQRLLSRWHSHVLTVPKLCRLGYGGFIKRKSSIVDDNVSVSSWGVDEEELKERKQVLVMEEQSEEDSEKYMTADDATADLEEANAAFGLSTQPPIPEEDDDEMDDGDKKPRAKPTRSLRGQSPVRRSSRLTREERRKSPPTSPPRKRAPVQAQKSPGMESVVYSEEEVLPPRKSGVARKPASADDSSDSDEEPRLRAPPKKRAAVARMPPPADNDSSSESESNRRQERQAAARRRASLAQMPSVAQRPLVHRRAAKTKNPTVIEWSDDDSNDDEVPWPAKKSRTSFKSRRRSSGGKKQKKRRPFTDEEKEAIRAGIQEFGKGNWAVIRINSNGVLLSRTSVNIKDAYRTMEKRGEA